MKSIALINCYFGSFPNYFNLFLDSCRNNPTVDFLFFTDNTDQNLPENVRFVHITFEELRKMIQSKFDFEISLESPYKLCDYKPTYGFVFEDYISEYDYWGYCDVDMIFGNIRHFLTENILDEYDKFYKLGHLTLFRNSKEVNRCFMHEKTVSYKAAFTTSKIAVFDETVGVQKIFDEQGLKTYFARDYADITPAKNRFTLSDFLVDDIQKNNYKNQVFVHENGCIYRYFEKNNILGREEFEYIHLQKRKFKSTISGIDNYFITYNGFIPFDDLRVCKEHLTKYNGVDLIKEVLMKYRNISFLVKRKINKMRIDYNEHLTSTVYR